MNYDFWLCVVYGLLFVGMSLNLFVKFSRMSFPSENNSTSPSTSFYLQERLSDSIDFYQSSLDSSFSPMVDAEGAEDVESPLVEAVEVGDEPIEFEDVNPQQNAVGGGEEVQVEEGGSKKRRKLTSWVWSEMAVIKDGDEAEKVQCSHCKVKL